MSGFNDLILASAESLIVEDLYLAPGSTWNKGWTLTDGDENLVDFTSATAVCDIRVSPGGEILSTFTSTLVGGKRILLGNGTVNLTATPAATSLFAVDADYTGVYEIKITLSGQTLSLARGKIIMPQQVTTSV